ncbi:hypothetical protein HDU92_008009 [Lobulomyces angularis]|nr:hypothetical protein HDU92_008009 [Lobulomyces angularis]
MDLKSISANLYVRSLDTLKENPSYLFWGLLVGILTGVYGYQYYRIYSEKQGKKKLEEKLKKKE